MNRNIVTILACIILPFSIWIGKSFSLPFIEIQAYKVSSFLFFLFIILSKLYQNKLFFKKLERPINLAYTFIIISLVLMLISMLFSTLEAKSVFLVFRSALNYVVGLILIQSLIEFFNDPRHIHRTIDSLILGGLFSIYFILAGMIIPSLSNYTIGVGSRAQGFLNNPNQFAMILSAVYPIVISKLLVEKKFLKNSIILLTFILGVIMSGSKMNIMLIFGVTIFIIIAKRVLEKNYTKILSLIILIPVVFFALNYLLSTLLKKFSPRTFDTLRLLFSDPTGTSTVNSRLHLWQKGIELGNNYVFGVGFGNIGNHVGASHLHNIFVNFYATTGIFGLLTLCLFILSILLLTFYVFVIFFRAEDIGLYHKLPIVGISMGVISYIISNQTSDSFGGTTLPVMWILLGLLLSYTNMMIKVSGEDKKTI